MDERDTVALDAFKEIGHFEALVHYHADAVEHRQMDICHKSASKVSQYRRPEH